MKNLSLEQIKKIEGGKFWGFGEKKCHPCDVTGHKKCYTPYYVFWIRVEQLSSHTYEQC